jgi:hypothetical protein
LAGDHDHEVVGIPHELHDRAAGPPVLDALPFRTERRPAGGEVLIQNRQGDVGQQRREDAALGGAGDRLAVLALFAEDPRPQERRHQAQDPLVPNATSHPAHEGGVVDLVEARRDVGLQHPLVVPIG